MKGGSGRKVKPPPLGKPKGKNSSLERKLATQDLSKKSSRTKRSTPSTRQSGHHYNMPAPKWQKRRNSTSQTQGNSPKQNNGPPVPARTYTPRSTTGNPTPRRNVRQLTKAEQRIVNNHYAATHSNQPGAVKVRRQNPRTVEMTYEQVQAEQARGVVYGERPNPLYSTANAGQGARNATVQPTNSRGNPLHVSRANNPLYQSSGPNASNMRTTGSRRATPPVYEEIDNALPI